MAVSACRSFFCRIFGGRVFRSRSPTASPSQVRFLPCPCGLLTFDPVTRDAWLERLEENLAIARDELPRLQVAESGGQWFALNNAHLAALRELERRGRCNRVVLNVVPLSRVPPLVRRAMKIGTAEVTSVATSEAWATPTLGQREVVTVVKRINTDFLYNTKISELADCPCTLPMPKSAYMDTSSLSYRVDSPFYDGSTTTWEGDDETTTTDEETDDLSEDLDEEDEEEGCGVCDRYFASEERLLRHQVRRGHFGCTFCDATLPTPDELAIHQMTFHSWLTEPLTHTAPPPLPSSTSSTPKLTPRSNHRNRLATVAMQRARRHYHHAHQHRQGDLSSKRRRAHPRTTRDEMESLL